MKPHHTDAALFAYIGEGWANGQVLYRDLWDHKPPGVFALDALVSHFWPRSFVAIAGMEFLFILATIFFIFRIAQELNAAAGITAWIAAIVCNLSYYNQGGNLTETYLILPEAASAYAFIRLQRTGKLGYAIALGVLAGIAALFKPVGLAPLLAAIAYYCLFERSKGPSSMLLTIGAMCAGAFAAWLPFIAYFWSKGLLGELLFASFTYNIYYYGDYGVKGLHRLHLLSLLEPVTVLAVSLPVLAYIWVSSRHEQYAKPWAYVLLWAVADIAGALAASRSFAHYFLPTMVSLSVCLGIVFGELVHQNKRWIPALAALILASLLLAQAHDLIELRDPVEQQPWEEAVAEINSDKAPGSTLFCWDYLPGIYLYTGLRSPTRHLFAFRLAFNRAHAEEILGSVEHDPATYVVFRQTDALVPRFSALLSRRYAAWRTSGDLSIYKLK